MCNASLIIMNVFRMSSKASMKLYIFKIHLCDVKRLRFIITIIEGKSLPENFNSIVLMSLILDRFSRINVMKILKRSKNIH